VPPYPTEWKPFIQTPILRRKQRYGKKDRYARGTYCFMADGNIVSHSTRTIHKVQKVRWYYYIPEKYYALQTTSD
jgi:hypothetical protein